MTVSGKSGCGLSSSRVLLPCLWPRYNGNHRNLSLCGFFSVQVTWVDFSLLFQAFALSRPPCPGYSFRLGFVYYNSLTFLFTSSHLIFASPCKMYLMTNYGFWDEHFESDVLNCAPKVEVHLGSSKNCKWSKDLTTVRCRKQQFNAIICIWKENVFFQSMRHVY